MSTSGCLVCGDDLVYSAAPAYRICAVCGAPSTSAGVCTAGHHVCDGCHSLSANDVIERSMAASGDIDPMATASALMRSGAVAMHGPEHHYLVAAVLIGAVLNSLGFPEEKGEMLAAARARAEEIKGGVCGLHGSCGAAIGAGIACSVITRATPLSRDEWRLSNRITADCLHEIAEAGGPRCCKRDSFIAIREATRFFNTHLEAGLPERESVRCEHAMHNRECLREECGFFGEA